MDVSYIDNNIYTIYTLFCNDFKGFIKNSIRVRKTLR